MASRLVIAIGNSSRGDDGVAHAVASALDGRLPDDTRLLRVRQLDIVMAEEIAAARCAVFVDAERRAAPPVLVEPVVPGESAIGGHFLDPPGLLGVARTLFGSAPRALIVTVAAPSMGHGETLSEAAQANVRQAAETVLDGLRDLD